MVTFEHVLDGANRFIDKEIFSGLNELQEFAARLVVGRFNQNAASIKTALINNGFVRTMCVIDSDGMVDIESLLRDAKAELERRGTLTVNIPLIGKLTFCPADVDTLSGYITGGK